MLKRIWGYWYSVYVALLLILGFTGLLDQFTHQGGWNEAPFQTQALISITMVTMFGFWFLMLADFFANRDVRHPILIGFCLIFFSWLAILIYFWTVVANRNSGKDSEKATGI